MNMDGTMGRRRSTTTWAEPWYEHEYEDEDAHRKTFMDGTMGRRRTQSLANSWTEPWYENKDEDTHKRMEELTNAQQRTFASLLASGA